MESDDATEACHFLSNSWLEHVQAPSDLASLGSHPQGSGSSTSTKEEGTILPARKPWNQASTAKLALRPDHEPKQMGAVGFSSLSQILIGHLNSHQPTVSSRQPQT